MSSRADNREKTTEKVLAAAERLFADRSFQGSTVRDIAKAAGVSVGTVMGVGDKSGLLVQVFERQIRRIHDDRREYIWSQDDIEKDLGDRVVALLWPFVQTFTADPALSREYGAVLMRGSHSSKVFQELAEVLVREITLVLNSAGFVGEVAAARTIYLSYLGLLFVWAGSGRDDDASFVEGIHSVVHFIIRSREG